MVRRLLRLPFFAIPLLLLSLGAVQAEDEGGMDPAAMEAMMAAMQPGPHHEHLAHYVGEWNAVVKAWMGPGEPVVSEGTAHYEWILGGRYLQGIYHSTFMGMPFEGRGIEAYDNVKGEYISLWMDTMGTGVMIQTGSCSDDGKRFELSGRVFDPTQGMEVGTRMVNVISDADHHTSTMYTETPAGEVKSMEIVYTRITQD